MATDALILGPFVFDDWSTPDHLPFGGRQQVIIHRMPGGSRVVDCMGPDDHERIIVGKLYGSDAINQALMLDALRSSGSELPYSNGVEARTVVIAEFSPRMIKVNYIEFDMTLVTSDDSGGGAIGFGISAIDNMLASDLSAAVSLLS